MTAVTCRNEKCVHLEGSSYCQRGSIELDETGECIDYLPHHVEEYYASDAALEDGYEASRAYEGGY